MFRRAVSSLRGHVAFSQRRGFLTLALQNGHENTEYKLSLPWDTGVASPRGDAITRSPSRGGNESNSRLRVTLHSVEKGGTIASSSELMDASRFDPKIHRGKGSRRTMVDLHIWPQELRATATIMSTDNSRWAWHSTWNFNMVATQIVLEENSDSQNEKNFLPLTSSHRQHVQYKGFISKQIAAEFEVSMKANFSIHQSLGRGAEGKVFKCISKKGDHPCAVKRYNLRKAVGDEPREPRIMKMLCHPNVKRLYIAWNEKKADRWCKDSTVYLAQELCKGNFDDYLAKRAIKDIPKELKLFKEIVAGLRYLHQQGVIHRDIKPSNIFIDDLNNVKIGDFGSGALNFSASCLGGGKFWGTMFYASPELWRSNAHNEKTDVFSLGVVYFELFGGFATDDERYRRLEELKKVLNSRDWKNLKRSKPLETWLKSNVSRGWAGKPELLIQMLQTSPKRRPRCLDILLLLP